jgi:hypoxanthine phosphoribosyltransferase
MRGRNVLIVEDIIDSGLSIREVNNYIESRGAAKVKTAAFLDKAKSRKVPFNADFVGFTIEPQFVIGYGLDFAEKYRNIPEVQVLSD